MPWYRLPSSGHPMFINGRANLPELVVAPLGNGWYQVVGTDRKMRLSADVIEAQSIQIVTAQADDTVDESEEE